MKNNSFARKMLVVGASTLLCSSSFAAELPNSSKLTGSGQVLRLNDLPPGQFTNRLRSLAPHAQINAKQWLNKLNFHQHDIPYMRLDKDGAIYIADPLNSDANITKAARALTQAAPVPIGVDVFKLHSNLGAPNVLYLDFDGGVITGTSWNGSVPSFNALAYDADGVPSSFSDSEKANIAEVWRRVAEDYAPFNIDITTEAPVSFGPYTGRVLITANKDSTGINMPANNSGGVAYMGVWGNTNYARLYSPAFVYHNLIGGSDNIAEAVSHEFGHNLGLSHDGTNTVGYYSGHGSGFISWAPIMGAGYYKQLSQWSAGEYANANQQQDDIAIISTKLALKKDDHSDMRVDATRLVRDANGAITSTTPSTHPLDNTQTNKGIINSRSDVDFFRFRVTDGEVNLHAVPLREEMAERGGNLDIALKLYDANGAEIASDDPSDETDASILTTVAEGTYYLAVTGVGSANYSDYASLGQYFISGALPSEPADTTAPTPNPMTWAVKPEAQSRYSIRMAATPALDDSGSAVEYYFDCVSGGNACLDSGWISSPEFTLSGLSMNTEYSFTAKARDVAGNVTNNSELVKVKTLGNQAPIANADTYHLLNNVSTSLNVLANDSDPDGDSLALIGVTQGATGTVTYTKTAVVYKPKAGFVGMDTFTYTLRDAYGLTATTTVAVELKAPPVSNINRAPIALYDAVTIGVGKAIIIPVLNNDFDREGDVLSITAVKPATRGTLSHNGKEVYYQAGSRVGTENLTYTISDGRGGFATAKLIITLVRN